MNCPECGEALQPGVRVCPNCEYELTEAEFAQNSPAPAAPEKPSVTPPSRPATATPTRPATSAPAKPTKPAAPAAPDVSMPESIMAHGDVSVASNQHDDHSVHTTQNTTHNTQNNVANNTTNNTQQTIIINVGAGGQLPGGIVDEQTTRAVNEVAAQQAQQQPRKPKPQQPKPKPQDDDTPTFTDKPQKDEKGVGSITGEGTIYVQTGRKMPAWLIILIVAAVIIIAGVFLFSGKKASPEPQGPAATETVAKPAATKPAATKPTAAKPAATTTTTTTTTAPAAATAPTETPASTSGTTTTTRPAATTSRAVADPYEDGMNAYRSGDYDKAVEQLNKAAQSAEKKKAADAAYKLGLMYETGDGVPADKQQAIEYYQKAAKLGSKEAKRKLM